MKWIDSGATFSPCGTYRYRLWRIWSEIEPAMAFCMLNPSTADAKQDDPTIRRCIGFAKKWGYGGLVVVNLFALRSTDPYRLYVHPNPIGPDNPAYVAQTRESVPLMVAAWGVHGGLRNRGKNVLQWHSMDCLGLTKDGHPRHPLYLRGDVRPMTFEEAERLQ